MMINCNECGKQISDTAVACPNCGAPIAKNVTDIKVSQVFGLVITVAGLALFIATPHQTWGVVGGMLLVAGVIVALL